MRWWPVLVLFALFGCRTPRIALKDVVRDSIYITRFDTLTRVVLRNKTDTVRMRDSVTVYRDADGKVERVDRWVEREHLAFIHDTVDTYRARYDSLAAVMQRQTDVPVPVVKKTIGQRLWPVVAVAVLLALSVTILHFIRRSRDNI